ncbi:MAG: beta-xylosidase, partial [Verrucomicrobia bacterium]|nr:beta-xylosidase [Verrucomicrobiota bacterium]
MRLLLCALIPLPLIANDHNSPPIEASITAHYDQSDGQLNPVWNFFGYDEGNYTFDEEGKKLLAEIAAIQPEPAFVRSHHLLTSGSGETWLKWSSTNAYSENSDGNPVYDWTIVDQIFDTYMELGLKPLVQIGFMPEALSSEPEPYTPKKNLHEEPKGMVTGGAFHPPADYGKWQRFIQAWATHCRDRYGREEASSWYWELWNEPNGGYWKGTPEEYFRLYDYTAAAIKKVLPTAPFGGPHITNPDYREGGRFLDAFLDHCANEQNAVTGRTGAPLDFIAFHAKGGTSWEQDHVRMDLGNHLLQINKSLAIIASYPEFRNLPLIVG